MRQKTIGSWLPMPRSPSLILLLVLSVYTVVNSTSNDDRNEAIGPNLMPTGAAEGVKRSLVDIDDDISKNYGKHGESSHEVLDTVKDDTVRKIEHELEQVRDQAQITNDNVAEMEERLGQAAPYYFKNAKDGRYISRPVSWSDWPYGTVGNLAQEHWLCDTGKNPYDNHMSLDQLEDEAEIRIQTAATTHDGYDLMCSDDDGWIYYDIFYEYYAKQIWILHKHTDTEVFFENKNWRGWYLGTSGDWLFLEQSAQTKWIASTSV